MNLLSLFSQFELTKVGINMSFAQVEFEWIDADRNAAWELYIELMTRIATQPLGKQDGDEKAALNSVVSLFGITREILRRRGRKTVRFSKVAIPVLNQILRPFTAKWHRRSVDGAFDDPKRREEFRCELAAIQTDLRNFNRMLAEIACVEDLTDLEEKEDS